MKRITELRKLSDEHHQGLVLARRARQAADGVGDISMAQLWEEIEQKFRDELEPHFVLEEDYIIPPLEVLGEEGLVGRLHEEHKILRDIVYNPSARSAQALKTFGEQLEQHIRFEERELFERIQQVLSPEALKAIEAASHKT